MENDELYEKAYKPLIDKIHYIQLKIYRIMFDFQVYNPDKGTFELKIDANQNDSYHLYTDEEMEIISSSKSLDEIIDKFFLVVKEKYYTNEFLGLMADNIIKELDKRKKDTTGYRKNLGDVSFFRQYNKMIFLDTINIKCENLKQDIKEFQDEYKINPRDDSHIIATILNNTRKQILDDIKFHYKDNQDYRNFIIDIFDLWRVSLFKKKPNKTYSAFKNLLEFHTVMQGVLIDLSQSFIFNLGNNSKNKQLLIISLHRAFSKNCLNPDRFSSIKSLCTAYMDSRTFDKHYHKIT